jgi:hypothetical protein
LGDQARNIDLEVTGSVATRVADTTHCHLGIVPCTTPLLFVAGKRNNGANALAVAHILTFRGWSDITIAPLVQPTDDNLRPNLVEQFQLLSDFGLDDKIHPLDWAHIQFQITQPNDEINLWSIVSNWGIAKPRNKH